MGIDPTSSIHNHNDFHHPPSKYDQLHDTFTSHCSSWQESENNAINNPQDKTMSTDSMKKMQDVQDFLQSEQGMYLNEETQKRLEAKGSSKEDYVKSFKELLANMQSFLTPTGTHKNAETSDSMNSVGSYMNQARDTPSQ